MKGKIVRGSGFRGCLNYVLNANKKAYIVGGNMVSRDAKGLAREFGNVRHLRSDCKQPVLHIALRLPAGEDVSDEQWLKIALTLFKLMRLSQSRPWVLVKHLGEHVHLVTSRVDYSGKVWTGEWEALRLIEATQQLEKLFRLTLTPGLRGQNRKQVRLTSGQLRKMQREMDRGEQPEVPVKVAIAERIEQAIGGSDGTFDDFKARVERLGVTLRLNTAKSTSHISGISFEYNGIVMKGSKVARAYSWQGLNQLLNERKGTGENLRTPQPGILTGPEPDDSRADQPKLASTGQRVGPPRIRSESRNVPTPLPTAVVVSDNGNADTDAVPDLLLSLLSKSPVTAGGGSIAGTGCSGSDSVIRASEKAHIPRERVTENFEDDDGPIQESDGPTMSF